MPGLSQNESTHVQELLKQSKKLVKELKRLSFSHPITHVYNPLEYAWESHRAYLTRFASQEVKVFFLGMNPGPWGMAQTGIPFGEIPAVRDWMGIETDVKQPKEVHPKRPIEGFACQRSEVSGRRLWGLFAEKFGKPEAFFQHHFVFNYCPLVFMEASGKNFTPDKLPAGEASPLMEACDQHLKTFVEVLQPDWVVGVGAYAENRAKSALSGLSVKFSRVLHPSPASPAANRDWAGTATRQLLDSGIWLDS
ncbi:MAG: uracil-DNA glycosylase family protein [Verrucomicrobiota bacterium]